MNKVKITEIEYEMDVDDYNLPTELYMDNPHNITDDSSLEEMAQQIIYEETGKVSTGFMLVF
jgi:hypothetical protein